MTDELFTDTQTLLQTAFEADREKATQAATKSPEATVRWMEHLSLIEGKDGTLIPMHPNRGQFMFLDAIAEQVRARRAIRAIILKARQIGFSTLIAQWFMGRVNLCEGQKALVMAHHRDGASSIFKKYLTGWESLPETVKTDSVVYSREKRLTLMNRSGVEVKTAGADKSAVKNERGGKARADTYHLAHISELAHMDNPRATLTAVRQAVPHSADTAVIIESTANGAGNVFHDEWNRAVSGESGYVPVFVGWQDHPEYATPFASETERERFLNELGTRDDSPYANEYDLLERGISAEQLNWRRRTIDQECGGDPLTFQQEYPSFPEEAFLTTGRKVFDIGAVSHYLSRDHPTPKRGELVETHNIETQKREIRLIESGNPSLEVFETPIEGESYIIGGDVAEGLESGDYSTLSVLKRKSLSEVAVYRAQTDGIELAEVADRLGRWYNTAWIAVEANAYGAATNLHLSSKFRYPKIFRMAQFDEGYRKTTRKAGWLTDGKSRPQLITHCQEMFRQRSAGYISKRTLNEAMTFVWAGGKPEAMRKGQPRNRGESEHGFFDDVLFAFMIAVFVNEHLPYPKPAERQAAPKPGGTQPAPETVAARIERLNRLTRDPTSFMEV